MEVKDLKPAIVWQIFDQITKVPRPSGKLEKIREWLVNFAKEHNLEYKVDSTGNVAMFRPAAPGFENVPTTILQGHMDMVAEKGAGSKHNFETDPIETIVDGEWVRANNTTLGADDGMGLAIALAALTDPDLKCGRLEALATVDEETGLTGASEIKADMLDGKYLLNLDSEDDGIITIGCAGGVVTVAKFDLDMDMAPRDRQGALDLKGKPYNYFKIVIEKLHGGHSGTDINVGYACSTRLIARLLWRIGQEMEYALASIDAGNLHNALAHAATAIVGVKDADKEKFAVVLNQFKADVENEYKHTEKNMEITCESTYAPERVIDDKLVKRLVAAVFAAPHGVASMSLEVEGLVETSTNLASVKMHEDYIQIEQFSRSDVDSRKDEIAGRIEALYRLAGAKEVVSEGSYRGWAPNAESHLLKMSVEQWEGLYGVKPKVEAIHAGLECGLFLNANPDLDMISYGPTLKDVHSPVECCHIPAVQKGWDFTVAMLNTIAKEG